MSQSELFDPFGGDPVVDSATTSDEDDEFNSLFSLKGDQSVIDVQGHVYFDIETEGRPIDELKSIIPPYDPGPHPGEFSESSVKLGRMKDPEKIRLKLEEAAATHQAKIETFESGQLEGAKKHFESFLSSAALSPLTGRLLCTGFFFEGLDDPYRIVETPTYQDEAAALVNFWLLCGEIRAAGKKLIGFNSNGFDMPFLMVRSVALGVMVPNWVRQPTGGRYLSNVFVDIREELHCGCRSFNLKNGELRGNLDNLCKSLGLAGKDSGMTGAEFAQMYRKKGTKQQALNYLKADIDATVGLGRRVFVAMPFALTSK